MKRKPRKITPEMLEFHEQDLSELNVQQLIDTGIKIKRSLKWVINNGNNIHSRIVQAYQDRLSEDEMLQLDLSNLNIWDGIDDSIKNNLWK